MMLTTSRASGSSITRNDAAVAIIPRPIDHAASRSVTGAVCFGPGVAEVRVHPRRGGPGSEGERTILKPHAGMTIRLTPELLATLQTPGPKPIVELMLKSVAEGGPVLVVGGVHYKTHSHKMAVGSEVHVVARTEPGVTEEGVAAEEECKQDKGQASARRSTQNQKIPPTPSLSIFASLHRKLIVQQVLTATKRAEIRARKHEIDLQEKQAKNKLKRMDDHDEKLRAVVSMPAVPSKHSAAAGVGGDGAVGGSHPKKDRKRGRSLSEAGKGGGEDGGSRERERDPLTAWVYDCYHNDGYAGHVSDLRQFLKGIEFRHVMFRYHVLPDGTLEPDRRRFCVRFKTKAGRDLAVGRSGEAFGAAGSWSPDSVAVVRGRNEYASSSSEDSDEGRVSEFLLVLPPGRSVAEVLKKVRARLPGDLTPALETPDPAAATLGERAGENSKGDPRSYQHDRATSSLSDPRERHRLQNHRKRLEAYRRDMLRAALGAAVVEAGVLGSQRGAPTARIVGTDEDNARRVATLGANEAGRRLRFDWKGAGAKMGLLRQSAGGGTRRTRLPAGPPGGARAQRREAAERTR